MNIFSSIKNKYTTKKQQLNSQEKIMIEEVKAGFKVLSKEDKSFNYKKYIIVFCVLFFIVEIFIIQSPYTKYNSMFIGIVSYLNLFLFLVPMLLLHRVLRVMGRLQSQVMNHKE
jgi:hypothetical protein